MESWIFWAVLGVVVAMFITIYNRFIALRQRRKNAFSDIEVQLKLRYDLVPNLVETVKGYATHEKELFEKVTEARSTAMRGGSVSERGSAEGMLGSAMMNLMAVAENYPDLKADANFRRLQDELSDIENKIAAARRFFNSSTNEFNAAIQQFPAVLLAKIFNFAEADFFELSAEEKDAVEKRPEVSFN